MASEELMAYMAGQDGNGGNGGGMFGGGDGWWGIILLALILFSSRNRSRPDSHRDKVRAQCRRAQAWG